ncbi:hypothetical protein D030_4294A, partial [Vibrio parahaemolyticus AQ3810]|jgi:hypothetical protein
MTIG